MTFDMNFKLLAERISEMDNESKDQPNISQISSVLRNLGICYANDPHGVIEVLQKEAKKIIESN